MINAKKRFLVAGIVTAGLASLVGGILYFSRPKDEFTVNQPPANAYRISAPVQAEEPCEKQEIKEAPKKIEITVVLDEPKLAPEVPETKTPTLESKIKDYGFDLPRGRIYSIAVEEENVCKLIDELNSRDGSFFRFLETTGEITGITTLENYPDSRVYVLPKAGVYDLWENCNGISCYKRTIDGRKGKVMIIDNLSEQRTREEIERGNNKPESVLPGYEIIKPGKLVPVEPLDKEIQKNDDGWREAKEEPEKKPVTPQPMSPIPDNSRFQPFQGILTEGYYSVITGADGKPILFLNDRCYPRRIIRYPVVVPVAPRNPCNVIVLPCVPYTKY